MIRGLFTGSAGYISVGWMIAVLVGLMMIGSILWVRPSAGDRRRMELRQKAMQLGLQVRIEHLEVPGEERPRQLAAYTLRRSLQQREQFDPGKDHWTLLRKQTAFLDELAGEWSWLVRPKPLPQGLEVVLSQLPESVQAIGSTRDGWTIYWDEMGDAETLDGLRHSLVEAFSG